MAVIPSRRRGESACMSSPHATDRQPSRMGRQAGTERGPGPIIPQLLTIRYDVEEDTHTPSRQYLHLIWHMEAQLELTTCPEYIFASSSYYSRGHAEERAVRVAILL